MPRASFAPLFALALALAGCRATVPVRGEVVLPAGAVVPAGARPEAVDLVEARIASARVRGAAFAAVSGDTTLGDGRSQWVAHLDGAEPVLVEETVAPDGGGQATFTYAFERGRLAAFRERGERVGLLPGRPSTFARVDVDMAFEPQGEPAIAHRIEGLPSQPEPTLPAQVLARVSKLVAFARAKAGK